MAYIFKHYSKTTPTGTGIVFTAYKLPSYSITYNLTNLTSDATNPATIGIGETASIRITAPTGYNLPSRITVTGCEYTWEANTGVLNISNPTGNVTIAAEGVAETYSVTVRLTGVTGESTNPTTVSYGGSATFKFITNENYELPADVEQTGATSYNWNKATGTLVLTNITGSVTITVTGVATTPQLATPQNVAINGTTLSWDAVENATSYDIYADGTLIGNTDGGAVGSGYTVTITEAAAAGNYVAYINGVGVPRDLSTNIQVFHNVKTFNIECTFTGNRIYNATGSLTNVSWDNGFAYSEAIEITEDSSASLDTDQ